MRAWSYWRSVQRLFTELDEYRAFEMMRNMGERVSYLLCKEAKIVAMTCTHCALRRRDLLTQGFQVLVNLQMSAIYSLWIRYFIQDTRYILRIINEHSPLFDLIYNLNRV